MSVCADAFMCMYVCVLCECVCCVCCVYVCVRVCVLCSLVNAQLAYRGSICICLSDLCKTFQKINIVKLLVRKDILNRSSALDAILCHLFSTDVSI